MIKAVASPIIIDSIKDSFSNLKFNFKLTFFAIFNPIKDAIKVNIPPWTMALITNLSMEPSWVIIWFIISSENTLN